MNNNGLTFIDNTEFYFFINLKKYSFNQSLGIGINYDSKCEIQLYYLPEISNDKIPDLNNFTIYDYIEYNYQNSFLIKYYDKYLKIALIKVKIYNYLSFPLKIDLFENITYINEIPFNTFIKKNKYFFVINDELKEKYYDIKNNYALKFKNTSDNMIIYTSNYNQIFKDKIDIEKLEDIISICFIDAKGDFEIYPLSSEIKILKNKKNIFE
jgi:hypothetical protein